MYIILVFVKGIGELRDLRSVEIEDITEAVVHCECLAIGLSFSEADENALIRPAHKVTYFMLHHESLELFDEVVCLIAVDVNDHTLIILRFLIRRPWY